MDDLLNFIDGGSSLSNSEPTSKKKKKKAKKKKGDSEREDENVNESNVASQSGDRKVSEAEGDGGRDVTKDNLVRS